MILFCVMGSPKECLGTHALTPALGRGAVLARVVALGRVVAGAVGKAEAKHNEINRVYDYLWVTMSIIRLTSRMGGNGTKPEGGV